MVNASLNWASIVGIVLAVGGALLYFMRSFRPALARDYDVFFAAVGLLCGGILFFQGWRLDPILQFGQFLLAGTTVFFAYESVRLRGVATEQARRVSFFEEEESPMGPRPGLGGSRRDWDERDRFDEPRPLRRRLSNRYDDDDRYDEPPEREDEGRVRRPTRAIPERAASRRFRDADDGWDSPDSSRPDGARPDLRRRRPDLRAGSGETSPAEASRFGTRRNQRADARRGSRPVGRASDRSAPAASIDVEPLGESGPVGRRTTERAAGSSTVESEAPAPDSGSSYSLSGSSGRSRSGPSSRDNSSRFDD
ncbi:hypothetical protein EVJ50_12885 [Synechococcus sp. RSCCF101]|uniref:Ycf66 family protein n=1 Tax=Synechococcus sp. RSCCF101 TaxID=2511069 RepID=UPI00124831AD|nr:Ycf66 family protein [Synechococcus sp. RSCCF101]QEY32991.1 hypothetical protein EVJ50_12885 [Synechococcus sp. RSCCF101]